MASRISKYQTSRGNGDLVPAECGSVKDGKCRSSLDRNADFIPNDTVPKHWYLVPDGRIRTKYSDREILYSQDQNRLWYGRICFVEDNDNRFPHYNQDQYRYGPDQQISHVFQIQKYKYAPDPQTPNNITTGYNFVQIQLPINAHTAKQRL